MAGHKYLRNYVVHQQDGGVESFSLAPFVGSILSYGAADGALAWDWVDFRYSVSTRIT
jgi:hypothetical protein